MKILLKNDISTKSEAKRKNITQKFIKNIRFFDAENLVYHATSTPYLARNPVLRFKYSGVKFILSKISSSTFKAFSKPFLIIDSE